MIKINPLENGKRQIDIDTSYLRFKAIIGSDGEIEVEASEVREPRTVTVEKTKQKKDCNCGKRK